MLPIARCGTDTSFNSGESDMVTSPLRHAMKMRGKMRSTSLTRCNLPRWAQSASASPSPSVSPLTSTNSKITTTLSTMSKSSFKWTPSALVYSRHGKLSDSYDLLGIVGEGRAGTVFIVEHKKNSKRFACKFLKKRDHDLKALKTEVQTLRGLDHPNIVRLYETHEDKDTVFLLMELCSGGDLMDNISEAGNLSEQVTRVFARQMLSALAYCHANGVAHRDVKPENFLLEREGSDCLTLKLADFGVATCIRPEHLGDNHRSETACGSVPYMAPETFSPGWWTKEVPMAQLAAADLWSCGVTIYGMLSGHLPFGESADVICSGRPAGFAEPPWNRVSAEAMDLVQRLLNPNARDRWTAEQALAHPWLREAGPMRGPTGHVREFALAALQGMRRWRQMPKLRRIAVAAIAKRLETRHEALRAAESAYVLFSSCTEALRCEQLIRVLYGALCEAPVALPSNTQGGPAGLLRRLTGASQDSVTTLAELQYLVSSLDGLKSGNVDYTLFVASMLPPDMCYSEQQISEVFGMFDTKRRGFISPGDLQVAVRSGDADLKHYSALIAEFDINGDGVLDLGEFGSMVQGGPPVRSTGGAEK